MINFENFFIRPLQAEDLIPYFDLVERNRGRLEDFFAGTTSRTKTLDETKAFLDEMVDKREARRYFPFLIVDNITNEFVAFFDLKNISWSIPKAEVGCYTDLKFEGKGLTTRAMKVFISYCFDHFKFKKILLRTHESNLAAKALARKCGFEQEGIIKMDYKTSSGEIIDLIYYGKYRS